MQLHDAANDGDTKMVAELLQDGVDVNYKDGFGYTAMHFATHAWYVT